jgi:hypothetical protein
MSFLKKVSRHNGIIAILKSHFNSYTPLISQDFFYKSFFIHSDEKAREKSREIMAGKFKCNFIKSFGLIVSHMMSVFVSSLNKI